MIRPVEAEISQHFGDNPTANILPGSPDYWIIEKFGNYQPDGHTGEDYAVPVGTPVRAVADGTVLHIGWVAGTYADNPWWVAPGFAGYCAVIDHGPFIGIYGHCSDGSAKVANGDRVAEGQVFILSGNTGGSTGPHVHFEILPDGYVLQSRFYGRVDPEPFFGTISAQSSSTTVLEDTLSAAEVTTITEAINFAFSRIKKEIPVDTAAAVLACQVPHKDPVTGADDGQTTSLATVAGFTDFQHNATRTSLPAAVLNQGFTLPDGTVTNLAGILGAINAKPAGTTNVTGADPSVVVAAIKAQWAK